MLRLLPTAFLVIGIVAGAWGQPITQEQAIRQALASHPRALAARSSTAAARSAATAAHALRNPEIALNPALTRDGADNELVASQMFELNGARRARSGAASARLRAARFAQASELRALASETSAAYIDVAKLQERQAAEREILKVAEDLEKATRRQVDVGTKPGIELTSVEIETASQARIVREVESQLRSARTTLALLLGRDAEGLTVEALPDAVADVQTDAAQGSRSETLEQQALAEALVGDRAEVLAEGKPDLGVQAISGSFTREPRTAGIGLLISLPIVDYGARRKRAEELRRLEEAQRRRVEASVLEVRIDVARASERLGAARANLAAFRDGLLDKTSRLFGASRLGFQAGQTSLVQLLEAQRTYRRVQNEYVDAKAEAALALTDYMRATGALASDLIREATK